MLFQKNKKSPKKLQLALIFPVIVFYLLGISSIITPSKAFALADNDQFSKAEQQGRTQLYALQECLKNLQSFMAGSRTGDQINNHDIFVKTGGDQLVKPVGHNIDKDDGKRQCKNMDFDDALGFVGMTWEQYWQQLYTKETGNGQVFYIKKSGGPQRLYNFVQSKLNAKKHSNSSIIGPAEKDERVIVGVSRCIEKLEAGTTATRTEVEINGVKYQYQKDNEPSDNISVGYDLEPRDGQMECGTLVNLARNVQDLDSLADKIDAATASATKEEEEFGCETWTSNPLNWVICPVVNTLVDAVDWLDKLITAQMVVNTKPIFGNSNGNCVYDKNNTKEVQSCIAYRSAWVSFRNIALGILLIAGLVVLISQALGLEILDAYTIRKILPRLLIVAVGITLSWTLMRFLVELTNDLGYGIRNLIYAPFEELPKKLDFTFGGEGITHYLFGGGILSAATVTGVTVWIAAGGAGVILSFAGTALLAVAIALIVLILREMVIILFIIIAPLAIVMYVLPNTEKYYKFWWESFSKALLMFPFIAAFIATGRVFAGLALSVETPTAINQVIAFVAYFAPYFMIPFTFKFAGGALSQIGGFVNARGQSGFGALSKYRAGQRQKRITAARSGGLYRKDLGQFKLRPGGKVRQAPLGKFLNAVGSGTLDADESWVANLGRRGPLRPVLGRKSDLLHGQIEDATVDHSAKALQGIKGGLHHATGWALAGRFDRFDDAEKAAIRRSRFYDQSTGRMIAPKGKKDVLELAEVLGSSGGAKGAKAAQQLRANASYFGAMQQNPETQRADLKTMGLMAAASQGRLEVSDLVETYNDENSGPLSGLAAKRLSTLETMAAPKRPDQREGHGVQFEQAGTGKDAKLVAKSAYDDAASSAAYKSVDSMKGGELTNAKGETIKAAKDTITMIALGNHPESVKDGVDNRARDMRDMQQTIAQGATNPYSDPASRKIWQDIALEAHVSPEMMAEAEAAHERARGNPATPGGAGPAEPPAPPPA